MAMHKLGKLTFGKGEEGLGFRFGEGKFRRLDFWARKDEAYDNEAAYDEEGYDQSYDQGYDQDGYHDGEAYDQNDGYADGDSSYNYNDRDERDEQPLKGYRGRFHRPERATRYEEQSYDYGDDAQGYDDGYADDGYANDGYADDGYADDGYADERGYDDGYSDEQGYDESYNDSYSDQDAEDYRGDGFVNENPLMRYIDEHDWVTYLLLVVLPPMGIWLLWRRYMFDKPVRIAVSVVSGIWFIFLMWFIISGLIPGSSDKPTPGQISLITPTPTAAVVTVTSAPTAGADDQDIVSDTASNNTAGDKAGDTIPSTIDIKAGDSFALDPTATPLPGGNQGASAGTAGNAGTTVDASAQESVLTTVTGEYYHNNPECTGIGTGATSRVTREVANKTGKTACPICYPGQDVYYATEKGTYYHSDPTCSRMQGAKALTKERAEMDGKQPCPACVTKKVVTVDKQGLRFFTAQDTDRSGRKVYATKEGQHFHTNATCSGMKGATQGPLGQAMLLGKTPCPVCAKSAANSVYCTKNGKYYHAKNNCSNMVDALPVTLAEAMILGKTSCPVCMGEKAQAAQAAATQAAGIYVYGTPTGKYYHTNATCSGMTGAQRVVLGKALAMGRPACPVCAKGADKVVYATKNGTYYHSFATCSDMEGATAGTLAQAKALGKAKCPKCWGTTNEAGQKAGGTYVYATKNGTYYHTNATCSGMVGAAHITLNTAVSAGKRACPTCATAANRMVYSTDGGTWYHSQPNCSDMENAKHRTLESALMLGQRACPVCMGAAKADDKANENAADGAQENADAAEKPIEVTGQGTFKKPTAGLTGEAAIPVVPTPQDQQVIDKLVSSNTYTTGTSGIRVYATPTSKHFHTRSDCSGMENAYYITLETALNYGKTACTVCADSAATRVYAVRGGKYYHYSKTCAGAGAVAGQRASALALGMDPCPYCVSKTKSITSSGQYKSGRSGIKVWAAVNGKYYHADKTCAGTGATHVTLETAMNYGKKPCPNCASSAGKTVYATANGKYYHSSKKCAEPGAVAGSFAKALAMGKKECPICIGGTEAYETSDIKYAAPGDTRVYINLDSEMLYYHKNSRCNDAGMGNGTGVTLEFVKSFGYKACPYCAPPTSIE